MAEAGPNEGNGMTREAEIGFIGAGRLGSSLAIALTSAGYRVIAVSSRRASHREWLAEHLPLANVTDTLQVVVDSADFVFITSSDTAIREICDSATWRTNHSVVHSSGAASLDVLSSAALAGASTGGIHPMQTFPAPDAFDSFAGIMFGVESESPVLREWLKSLAEDLGGKPILITGDQRPAYHAAAVMACGLLAGLTGLAAEVWASSGGVTRTQAVSSLVPLVKTTANWMHEKGLPESLTGPYVRGDLATVRAHIEASSAVSAEHGAAYAALALASLHLAKEQGTLTADGESGIKQALVSALRANCEIIDGA